MFVYGGIGNISLSGIALSQILSFLEEEHWIKLAWNSQILKLMISLHKKDTPKNLAISGHIESAKNLYLRLKHICQCPSLTVVKRFIHGKNLAWSYGLDGACKAGRREIIDLMILKGAHNWNSGLKYACRGGHRDIVEYMMSLGANDWNGGLKYGCKGGYTKLVELMILNGANDWNEGLRQACKHGHREIVELMILKGANDWTGGLEYASAGGHQDLVDLMVGNETTMLNHGLSTAFKNIFGGVLNYGMSLWNHSCTGNYGNRLDLVINNVVDSLNFGLDRSCVRKPIIVYGESLGDDNIVVNLENNVVDVNTSENPNGYEKSYADTKNENSTDMVAGSENPDISESKDKNITANCGNCRHLDDIMDDSPEKETTIFDIGNSSNDDGSENSNGSLTDDIKDPGEKNMVCDDEKIGNHPSYETPYDIIDNSDSSENASGYENLGDITSDQINLTEKNNITRNIGIHDPVLWVGRRNDSVSDNEFEEKNIITDDGDNNTIRAYLPDSDVNNRSRNDHVTLRNTSTKKIVKRQTSNARKRQIKKGDDREIYDRRIIYNRSTQRTKYVLYVIKPKIGPDMFGKFIDFAQDVPTIVHLIGNSLWSLEIKANEIYMHLLVRRPENTACNVILKCIISKFKPKFKRKLTYYAEDPDQGEIKFLTCNSATSGKLENFINYIKSDKTDILSKQDISSTHDWRVENGLENYYDDGRLFADIIHDKV